MPIIFRIIPILVLLHAPLQALFQELPLRIEYHTPYSPIILKKQLEGLIEDLLKEATPSTKAALYFPVKANQDFFPVHSPLKQEFGFDLLQHLIQEVAREGQLFYFVDEKNLTHFREISDEHGVKLLFCQVQLKVVQTPDIYHLTQDWQCKLTFIDPHNESIIASKTASIRTTSKQNK